MCGACPRRPPWLPKVIDLRATKRKARVRRSRAWPASTQRNRYGEASDAIVLEGREALFMRRGHEPLTCMR